MRSPGCFRKPTRPPVFADAVSAFKVLRLRPWLGALQLLQLNWLELQARTGETHRVRRRSAAQLALAACTRATCRDDAWLAECAFRS